METQKYSIKIRLIHWVMAALLLGMVALGIYMSGLDNDVSYKWNLYGWHKSFGVLLLLLVTLRLVVRLSTKSPPMPAAIAPNWRKLAKLGHVLLYTLMFAIPIAGITMSQAGGHPIVFFGLELPVLIEKNKELGGIAHELHEILAYTLLAVVALHVAGVIKHAVSGEYNLLSRMSLCTRKCAADSKETESAGKA